MSIRNLHILILVSVAYVAAQMVADISNLRNLTLFGLSVSAFSIAYPLTFTLRDMAHKLAGPYVARTLIIAAAAIYLVAQAFFTIISNLSPEMTEAERITLGQLLTPEWRFLAAAVLGVGIVAVGRHRSLYALGRALRPRSSVGPRSRQQRHRHPARSDSLFDLGLCRNDVDRGHAGGLHRHDHRAAGLRYHIDTGHLSGRGAFRGLDPHNRNPPYRSAVIRALKARID